ncbi:unnamed protein product, partial [Sphacelaria rigidula]
TAWKALAGKYDSYKKVTRRACYDELCNTEMQHGQDPENFFYKMDDLRARLHDTGEVVSDGRYEDIILHSITNYNNFVRQTSFRDRNYGLEEIKSTMRNMFIDNLSRVPTKFVVGRGVNVQAGHGDLSSIQCINCAKYGHRRNTCPEPLPQRS